MRAAAAALSLALAVTAACGEQAVRTDHVRIFDVTGKPESDWGYDPRMVQVAKGTTVTFTNGGSVFHTVTSDDATRAFDVGANAGERVTIVFDRAGTWPYHCGVHPDMKGVVQVCDGTCR